MADLLATEGAWVFVKEYDDSAESALDVFMFVEWIGALSALDDSNFDAPPLPG